MSELTPAEQIVRDALGETDAHTYNGTPHDLDHLARRTAAKLRDHARATTPGDDRGREPGERPDRRTPRDELPGPYRAVSDVLDDYLMREYGRITSHNGWDVFLDLLVEQGYEVRALAARAGDSGEEKGEGPATLYDAVLSALNALADDLPGEPPVILAWDPATLAGRVTDLVEKSGLLAAAAETEAVTAIHTELARAREQRDRALDFADAQVRELERSTTAGGEMALARRRAEVDRLRRLAATPPAPEGEAGSTQPALGQPEARFEWHDEDGQGHDAAVGWDLAFGCQLSIGYDNGALRAVVAMSDASGRGHEVRAVTEDQVRTYGTQLLALVSAEADTGPHVESCAAARKLLDEDDTVEYLARRLHRQIDPMVPSLLEKDVETQEGYRAEARRALIAALSEVDPPAPAGTQAEGAGETAGGER